MIDVKVFLVLWKKTCKEIVQIDSGDRDRGNGVAFRIVSVSPWVK